LLPGFLFLLMSLMVLICCPITVVLLNKR